MSKWKKYVDLEPIKRLRNEGRELLGKQIHVTEKRDGENVSVWLDEVDTVHISSHNLEVADKDIATRLQNTPEYMKIVELLYDEKHQWHNDCIVYGELLKTVSPTRIEPRRKHVHWILFDIYSITEEKYLPYTLVYQKGYHFKIPVVRLIAISMFTNMDELDRYIQVWMGWCRRHRREGVVGKCYSDNIFFKEKVDLPDKPKLDRVQQSSINYPVMPEETIIRALKHAFDEVGESNWKNVKITMPIVAKHISNEAREHNYSTPKNFYAYYVNTPLEKIKN